MPELPEVETIRIGLQKYLVGHTIRGVDVRLQKQLSGNPVDIVGAKIVVVKRFGKGLVIDLDNGFSLTIHVKMTGQLLYKSTSAKKEGTVGNAKVDIQTLPDKYTHVIFSFDQGAFLYYRDVRQFGWIKIVRSDLVASQPFFKSLGPEPAVAKALVGRQVLTFGLFEQILGKRKTPIKILLMDQSVIAGIGNIYANDALYLAGVHPTRPANSLTKAEQHKLFAAIEAVLKQGIAVGGASEWSYVDALGQAGSYQNFFKIYHKQGQPCPQCGTIIQTLRQASRSTFFCPVCQK
jgi:formamidopyrimidine-DNA glycosylase